ncbi:MAG: type II secretion system F family protein, partial [Candidatus Buchananbacteria bacterium]|nr:type II secretion system F family protein [Candidatus Buchananbacteria bacterium]
GTISEVFEKYKEIPPLVSSMLIIGEKTGRTYFMLENIFNFYKAVSENSVQNLSQLIEPVLILILGVGVGLLVSAVLLPIYSLVGAG